MFAWVLNCLKLSIALFLKLYKTFAIQLLKLSFFQLLSNNVCRLCLSNTIFYQEPITRSCHLPCILESTFARIFVFLENNAGFWFARIFRTANQSASCPAHFDKNYQSNGERRWWFIHEGSEISDFDFDGLLIEWNCFLFCFAFF